MRVTAGVDDEVKSALLTTPVGRLDANGATVFSEAIYARMTEESRALLIDLSGVDYVSSAGIGTLIRLLTRARQLGGAVSVFGCSPGVRQVMRIVSIETVLNVRNSLQESRERLRELGLS
jgi:anti-anti-sigma factor